jgi:hypothetical protein
MPTMPDKTEKLDFIGVNKIVLRPKANNEDFERLMKEEVFHISVADMVFRDASRVGDNKLYAISGAGDSREYLWTISYFHSTLLVEADPNLGGAQLHYEELHDEAQKKIKQFGKLTPLGILSVAHGT